MSRQANPTTVGIFVLIALFLGMGTVLYVGSAKLFRAEETFLVYFGESVNGLTVGAPVKFKGVPIGEVRDIRIAYNQERAGGVSYVPVFIEVDLNKVGKGLDDSIQIDFEDWARFTEEVRKGLRAKLQLASFITGQLYVELDYFAEAGTRYRLMQVKTEFKEIPSVPSVMAEFGATTSDMLAQIASINVKEINDHLVSLLERLDTAVQVIDFEAWNAAVVDTAESVQKTLKDLQVEETMIQVQETLVAVESLAAKLDHSMDPVFTDYHRVVSELSTTLERTNRVLANVEGMTDEESHLQREFVDALQSLQNASQAAEELFLYLNRNPKALITGRERP